MLALLGLFFFASFLVGVVVLVRGFCRLVFTPSGHSDDFGDMLRSRPVPPMRPAASASTPPPAAATASYQPPKFFDSQLSTGARSGASSAGAAAAPSPTSGLFSSTSVNLMLL